jgi:hypothetical protein
VDVHPAGAAMNGMYKRMVNTATAIKQTDPSALVVGPEEWGWSGYIYSGYNQQYGALHGWNYLPDRTKHGNEDYIPWLLDQLKLKAQTGPSLLDVVSAHYYPRGGEYSSDVSTSMQLLRNVSTRSLWDPYYVDQSWIDSAVQLISRMRGWVTDHYIAGTPVAITEYNWGGEAYINGATARADILGIFGREGLDMATRWTSPDPRGPVYKAYQMYRNYDGSKSTFGDTSVSTNAPDPDNVAVFGAQRTSDNALTVMVVCKTLTGTTPVQVNTTGFSGHGTARVYQLTASNTIQQLADNRRSKWDLRLHSAGAERHALFDSVVIRSPAAGPLPRPFGQRGPGAVRRGRRRGHRPWFASSSPPSPAGGHPFSPVRSTQRIWW